MKTFPFLNAIKTLPQGKYRAEIKRYLILLLIPILVLSLLYLHVNQIVSQQVEEYALLTADHFYVQSASMLHEMQLVSNAILQSREIAWVLEADSTNALNSLFVCDAIQDCLKESPYVQHAYLLCEKTGNIYSEQGLYCNESLSTILQNVGVDAADLTDKSADARFHVLNENGLAPYCIFPIHGANGARTGTLIVTLRMTEFLRIFYSLDAELCAVFNEDVFISSYIAGVPAEGFDWRDEASISALLGKRVTCEYLEQGDYTYLVAISRESYNRPLYAIITWFFLYAAAALVLGYLYLYQVSKRRYQRISAMIDALPVSYTGDQSYEHIYENIRKSLEDYRTQREHLQIENQEHRLHLLLDGNSDNPTAEQFRNAGVSPDYPVYYVAAFFAEEIPDPGQDKGEQRSASGFLHMLFRSTIHELAEQYQVSCAFCGAPKIGIAVLYGDDGEKLREIAGKLSSNVVEILTNSYGAKVRSTISNPVTCVQSLPDAYQEAKSLHSFAQSINSTAAVISQEELQRSSGVLLNGDFTRQEQILINTILLRKYDVLPSMVESILTSHVSVLRKNYMLAQSRIQAISNALIEGVRMAAFPSAEEDAKAIGQAESIRQLVSVTKEVYERMAAQCREAASEADIITTACNYIAQNLSDQNLNVAVICEAAGISVQRLTRMFQAQFHMAIAEYMNACRIKKAKELLTDKQLTISQIAQQVGYSNADTFTRNFKKIEGITASEYRKMLSNSQ